MKVADILRDRRRTLPVVPRAISNTIPGVHRRLTTRGARAEIGVPRAVACAGGHRQCLAVSIGAGKTAEIGAVPLAHAGHEERHRRWWCPGAPAGLLSRGLGR